MKEYCEYNGVKGWNTKTRVLKANEAHIMNATSKVSVGLFSIMPHHGVTSIWRILAVHVSFDSSWSPGSTVSFSKPSLQGRSELFRVEGCPKVLQWRPYRPV